jgi:hypothetical protein
MILPHPASKRRNPIQTRRALRRQPAESPSAFRSRMIFTFVEPLQRARFPRNVARICRPS